METSIQPWIDEWEDSGWWGLLGDFFEAVRKGIVAWWEGEGEFWSAVGDWISNLPEMVEDIAGSTYGKGAVAVPCPCLTPSLQHLDRIPVPVLRPEALGTDLAGGQQDMRMVVAIIRSTDDLCNRAMETPKSYQRNFAQVRRWVLDPAIAELAEKCALSVTVETERRGRKITHLRFTFEPIRQMALPFGEELREAWAGNFGEELMDLREKLA